MIYMYRFSKYLKEKLTMKKKALVLFLATMTATALLFTGCGNKENETTPVAEETIEEIEATEPEEIEPVEEDNLGETNEVEGDSVGASIIVDGEIVGGTALTQAEIDELKSTASGSFEKSLAIYEGVTRNGSYTSSNGAFYNRVVGTPGDTSWRRMTDEEAQRILETADPNSSEYSSAKAELQGAEWSKVWGMTNTVYFDYYEYKKVVQAHLEEQRNSEDYRIVHEEVQSPEEGSDEWRAALGWD